MSHSTALLSLLDNDFYKFTMQFAVIKLFPNAKARYQFINRGKHEFPNGFDKALRMAVNSMAQLQLTDDEKTFMRLNCPYLDPSYLDFLQGYRYDPKEVQIKQEGANIAVHIEGYWYRTILWEVPLMALISELYYQLSGKERATDEEVRRITIEKMKKLNDLQVTVADFGTRRRHSYAVHRLVMQALREHGSPGFIGSSNVHMAMLNQTKPIGTHAHEWFMFHAAKYGFKMANQLGLEHWVDVYRGDLGIALSDTYTTTSFFAAFDKKFAKLFDGVRHDSGDPLQFAQQTIDHYRRLAIDPRSKTIIFSDALNYSKVERIVAFCRDKIGMSFGIGTNLTNDVALQPLNIVIKMTEALPENEPWIPVVKLSDEKGKYTGDEHMIALAKEVLHLPS